MIIWVWVWSDISRHLMMLYNYGYEFDHSLGLGLNELHYRFTDESEMFSTQTKEFEKKCLTKLTSPF